MLRFVLRTVWQRLGLLVLISIVSHLIIHLAPGEPTEVDPMNPRMKAEDIARIRQAFHLDDPFYLQYLHWLRDLFTGNLKSFQNGLPVLSQIWDRFLNSLPLFACTTLIVWTLSFPTGIQAAVRRGSLYDRTSTFVAYTLISVPGFFLSYLLVLAVVQVFNLPVIGLRTFGTEGASAFVRAMDRVWHLVIPSLMSALTGIAVLSRYVRSQMLEVIDQDYVRTARAKGLAESDVIYGHALRNALLPFVTMFGFLLPGLISGSVIFEKIFAWPGLGQLGYDAIQQRDFPMILTLNFVAAALTLLGILVSDILYAVADPRIRKR
ncbi:MAG: oligopeptide transport system permease protein [Polyangiaceae bacterium]|jgi:peptide/nickel transport system permease protein|nr:oligopeptide transport system permease protein [Polyangiaceae bacterium]